jgi:CRISPR-associated exonuclease Cas4
MIWLFGLAFILVVGGWFSLWRATRLEHQTGLPRGRLVYADSRAWQPAPKPLYSSTYRLIGKPDYLVETPAGLIPVEVKSSPAPDIPYLGHLLQLAAYCLLVEETAGHPPPHGLLKYDDRLYEVDFTRELRAELLDTLAEMRAALLAENVERNHEQPGKCMACGFRAVCDEALSQ